MSYTAEERETVINCTDEDNLWNMYTLQSKVITKMKKLGIKPDRIDEDGAHHYNNLKFNQVSFRSGKRRTMSPEQKRAAAERLKKAREANKNGGENQG